MDGFEPLARTSGGIRSPFPQALDVGRDGIRWPADRRALDSFGLRFVLQERNRQADYHDVNDVITRLKRLRQPSESQGAAFWGGQGRKAKRPRKGVSFPLCEGRGIANTHLS